MSKRINLVALVTGLALVATAAAASATAGKGASTTLSGAGSTFVAPLVASWVQPYDAATGVRVNYNPIGSGGGIAAITNRSVDFGASDAPLTPDQAIACKGCVQIPWALAATAVAYNLKGVKDHLHVTGKVLAQIYLGKITKWNDPALKALNKGVKLPSTDITPIFRSDGSGTTYNFTDYLSTVSGNFAQKVGKGTAVNFPAGVSGRGSSGVSAVLSRTDGGIMYADVAYATVTNHFQTFLVQNKAGAFVAPGIAGAVAAAATVTSKSIPADNSISIVNPPKSQKGAYPISTFTFVILPTKSSNAAALRKFVFWALTGGAKLKTTSELLFAPMPHVVIIQAEKTLKKVQG
ncbi:MAG: phosphate ABC transporter substrate-binding protein PstS [Gaiellaceae bacterium]